MKHQNVQTATECRLRAIYMGGEAIQTQWLYAASVGQWIKYLS
jgi:hypothetical protein